MYLSTKTLRFCYTYVVDSAIYIPCVLLLNLFKQTYSSNMYGGCHGCDRMVVGFTTTYAISAYHH